MSGNTKIFISHAQKDKPLTDKFIDLILKSALSIPTSAIFCTSYNGTMIKTGDEWRESIKQNLLISDVVLLIITPNYKESEMCMNEMGAAWASAAKVIPLIVEPINYKTAGVIQEPVQQAKLLNGNDLDQLKDALQTILDISPRDIRTDLWNTKKNDFILYSTDYINKNPFPVAVERNVFDALIQENGKLDQIIVELSKENSKKSEQIEELKKTHDKEEVKKIEEKYQNNDISAKFNELAELCDAVNDKLSKFNTIVRGIIFNDYTGKGISIDTWGKDSDLSGAIAANYIDNENNVNWNNRRMKELKKALDNVSFFIESNLSKEFEEFFEEQYKEAELDINDVKFWEEVFDVYVSFN